MTSIALGNERQHDVIEEWVGVGDDRGETIKKFLEIILKSYFTPVSRQDANILEKFRNLKLSWQRDTKYASFAAEIVLHPSYLEIISMGKAAILLILNELKTDPNHWFWALSSITGENPIRPEQRGIIKDMVKAWLDWGKEQGYID